MESKKIQLKTFFLCWGAYTFAYLGRINLSVAIPLLEENLNIDKTGLGIIGSMFFWIYAFGQLINGRLGDRFESRYFVFIGLLLSGVFNLIFGFTYSLLFMVIFWALNGYFQSMLWGPLIKTLNTRFPEHKRQKIALYLFTSVVTGFILAWGVLGQAAKFINYKYMFIIPGGILVVFSFIWLMNIKSNKGSQSDGKTSGSYVNIIFKEKLYLTALTGVPLGFIREGIGIWAPSLLLETFNLNMSETFGAALLIPFLNFFGVVAARMLISRFKNSQIKLVGLFFVTAALGFGLMFFLNISNMGLYIALLSICSLSLYGATCIITSVIPLDYKMTSSAAGFLDFSIYLGAGISGIVTGLIAQYLGWNLVILIWFLVSIAAGILIHLTKTKKLG